MRKIGELWSFNTRDLMRAASCKHCTTLSVAHALEIPAVEEKLAPYIEKQQQLRAEGKDKTLPMKYGAVFEETLISELKQLSPVGAVGRPEVDGDIEGTIELMRRGIPVIYQGGLRHEQGRTVFVGKPDFLIRNDWEFVFSAEGLLARQKFGVDFTGYSAWDAKFASNAKADYALQVAIYIEGLDALGLKAENSRHGLLLGSRTIVDFEEGEIVPATRLARDELVRTIESITSDGDAAVARKLDDFTWHCDSNSECSICEYPELCEDDRLATSDLLLVAGLGGSLRSKLIAAGLDTMDELAAAREKPHTVSLQTFERVRAQAQIQIRQRDADEPVHEILENPAIQYLPKQVDGDVFFDMEGFPYESDGGLEYLFGNWTRDGGFKGFWAHNREEEKQAFIDFMTWVVERMERFPGAHIYHYASYEQTALRRLSIRHGVMQSELADLQREGRFVDLYPIVLKSMRVGEPKYSIKNLESHYGFKREKIGDASVATAADSIVGYDEWRLHTKAANDESLDVETRAKSAKQAEDLLDALMRYNRDDVKSTQWLYDWLAGMPGACTRKPAPKAEATPEEEARILKAQEALAELERETENLFVPLEDWPWGQSEEMDKNAQTWETLANSILFYRREKVMHWVDIFVRLNQSVEDMVQDKGTLPVIEPEEVDTYQQQKNGPITRVYRCDLPDEAIYRPKPGDQIVVGFSRGGTTNDFHKGEVLEIDDWSFTFTRRTRKPEELDLEPYCIIENKEFPTESKEQSLVELVKGITANWGDPSAAAPSGPAALDLVMRRPPRMVDGRPLAQTLDAEYLPALIDSALRMDRTTMAVQGPPGTGKTYLASHLIKELLTQGKRVAVTANSHAAIENVLEACLDAGVESERIFKAPGNKNEPSELWNNFPEEMPYAGSVVYGATSFALCNKLARTHHFDYLIVDEAAQFSLVDTLAGSLIADNIILFGDPQQLPQVVKASHPGGVEESALGHYMGEHEILPDTMGYFVEVTRRLHPEINKVVSWLAYENKLRSHELTRQFVIEGAAPGIHTIELDHLGNSTSSTEEVEKVLELVSKHIDEVGSGEILIVAPYNAQVNAIRRALDQAGYADVQVGTVDKFQGREGLVVIYSFAASSSQDSPRGLGFLLDRNRMNVAISRAKSVCYVVRSKHLLKANFSSVEDVKCVSRLAGLN
ncbi:TM0106 family RecB-like putative nuclease [Aquiluna sp. KACHI24]|uniref:TM0106 family RecB-like putative nuclease n=1 Tax=Aquiluna sp. KACHI24 TaxID=2968831 RepID=UPI0022322BB2|nr:TM0106 family RecB-like putative nuclease [Aquiluna sp. KACHI24]